MFFNLMILKWPSAMFNKRQKKLVNVMCPKEKHKSPANISNYLLCVMTAIFCFGMTSSSSALRSEWPCFESDLNMLYSRCCMRDHLSEQIVWYCYREKVEIYEFDEAAILLKGIVIK